MEYKKFTDRITLVEAAQELSVSTATVRNWIKLGRIEKVEKRGRSIRLDKNEIRKIREGLIQGKVDKLQSRRNKKMLQGNLIPREYISYRPYLRIVNEIINLSNRLDHNNATSLFLLEIALLLLYKRNRISGQVIEGKSLTELYIHQQLEIPYKWREVLEDLVCLEELEELSDEGYKVLSNLRQLEILSIPGEDFLGFVYMSLSASKTRKNSGSYYTPTHIVDVTITKNANIFKDNPQLKVLDPCCGSGNFLIKIFLQMRGELLGQGYSLKEAEREILERCLFGYDVNKTAVALSKLNLILLLDSDLQEMTPRVICKNTLFESDKLELETYDWIVGNPPWGYSFNDEEKKKLKEKFSVLNKELESFTLFIKTGIKLLKEGGRLSYVLPESFLNIKAHENSREELLRHTTVEHICILDQAFTSVFTKIIVLTFSKKKSLEGHRIKVIDDQAVNELEQRHFLSNDSFIFNIHSNERILSILERLRNHKRAFYLIDQVHAEYALGIVTGDNKNYISNVRSENAEVILTGKNIYKYNIKVEENYISFDPEVLQQVAPVRLYRANEKLLYRFINKELVFAYDTSQALTLNSANIVIPKHEKYQVKYVMAILNSRVAQFFHTYSYSALKVLKRHIESIPIPLCSEEEQVYVIRLVDLLLETKQPSKRVELYNQLDQLIMSLYSLDQDTYCYIHQALGDVKFLSK